MEMALPVARRQCTTELCSKELYRDLSSLQSESVVDEEDENELAEDRGAGASPSVAVQQLQTSRLPRALSSSPSRVVVQPPPRPAASTRSAPARASDGKRRSSNSSSSIKDKEQGAADAADHATSVAVGGRGQRGGGAPSVIRRPPPKTTTAGRARATTVATASALTNSTPTATAAATASAPLIASAANKSRRASSSSSTTTNNIKGSDAHGSSISAPELPAAGRRRSSSTAFDGGSGVVAGRQPSMPVSRPPSNPRTSPFSPTSPSAPAAAASPPAKAATAATRAASVKPVPKPRTGRSSTESGATAATTTATSVAAPTITPSAEAVSQPAVASADSSVVRHLQRVAQMESLPASSDVERAHQLRMSPVEDTDADSQELMEHAALLAHLEEKKKQKMLRKSALAVSDDYEALPLQPAPEVVIYDSWQPPPRRSPKTAAHVASNAAAADPPSRPISIILSKPAEPSFVSVHEKEGDSIICMDSDG
eukprot:m.124278 g.124278  ORF g.124278 m.124278 type:complete len:485 (-) comp16285_c0_seq3:365-1819(-)